VSDRTDSDRADKDRRARTDTRLGMGLMLLGSCLLAANDAIGKLLIERMSVGQFVTLRAAMSLAILLLFFSLRGSGVALRVSSWRLLLLRASCLTAAVLCFVTSLHVLPLAEALAIAFATPLFTALLGAAILREEVGWKRYALILMGFAGVLVIVAPRGEVSIYALLPLFAAGLTGLSDITSRHLMRGSSSLTIQIVTLAVMSLASTATALDGSWVAVSLADWGLIAVSAGFFALALAVQLEAFRLAEASIVAPFRYFALIFAALLGWTIWGHLPDLRAIVGAVLIVASGILLFRLPAPSRPR